MKESLHHIRSAIRRRLHVQQKDHDAEGAENITIASLSINNVTPPQSQDGKLIVTAVVPTVPTPLHVLCENCRKFERECRLLDYVGTKPLNTDPTKSIYELCSVVELLHNETTCHFCRLIAGSCESRAVQGSLENQFAAGDRVRLRLKLDVDNGYVSVQVQSQASGVTVAELCIYPIGMQRNDKPIRNYTKYPPSLGWSSIPLHAKDNLRAVRDWLEVCRESHENCRTFPSKMTDIQQKPTRVLDLSDGKVRLISQVKPNTTYMTLSHMWGTKPGMQLQLTTARLTEFCSKIPWKEISTIYKEAIRITLSLGYQYLWIDSLCIIQDSKTDWEAEAGKMASVYGNSACNICQLFPPLEEISKSRINPRTWAACRLRSPSASTLGLYVSRFGYECAWIRPRDWPLRSRAWAFQEQVLAPRNIYFGLEALVWECCETLCDELLGPVEAGFNTGSGESKDISKAQFCLTFNTTFSANAYKHTVLKLWEDMVNDYRSKDLTKPNDRIIAFAGIARAFSTRSNWTYVAGLWKEILPLCLLWSVSTRRIPPRWNVQGPESIEHGASNAPSWSWFSVPMYAHYRQIKFPLLFMDEEASHSDLTRSISWEWPSEDIDQLSNSSYYKFSNLQISLHVKVTHARLIVDGSRIVLDIPVISHLIGTNHLKLNYDHDDVMAELLQTVDPIENVLLGIFVKSRNDFQISGLALVPSSEGKWKRIGMWRLQFSSSWVTPDGQVLQPFDNCKEQHLTLV